jgi:mono/diheme cytochrome c family protein
MAAIFAAAVAAVVAGEAKLPPASEKQNITYATDIKPIFDASCVKCHCGDKAKARLRMDTLEGVLKGTNRGRIVTPGEPEKSLLVKSVGHLTKDRDAWMPPLHNKAGIKPLTPEEIGLIISWIRQGAK